jgi:hypothetical protein
MLAVHIDLRYPTELDGVGWSWIACFCLEFVSSQSIFHLAAYIMYIYVLAVYMYIPVYTYTVYCIIQYGVTAIVYSTCIQHRYYVQYNMHACMVIRYHTRTCVWYVQSLQSLQVNDHMHIQRDTTVN